MIKVRDYIYKCLIKLSLIIWSKLTKIPNMAVCPYIKQNTLKKRLSDCVPYFYFKKQYSLLKLLPYIKIYQTYIKIPYFQLTTENSKSSLSYRME